MATPKHFGGVGAPLVNPPRFTPGATSKIVKVEYNLVRTRGVVATTLTHAIPGSPRSRADVLGTKTLCGVRIAKSGDLLDYKGPAGPKCRACAKVVFGR